MLSLFTWHTFQDPTYYLIYFCLLVVPLVIVSIIDIEHRIIPDIISVCGIPVGVIVHIFTRQDGTLISALIDSGIGIAIGAGSLLLVAFFYERIKRQEGLGGGDVKLMAMLGAFFGWKATILILCISSIMGSLAGILIIIALKKDMKYALPFGPFLAAAGLIQLFFGQRLLYWYTHLF